MKFITNILSVFFKSEEDQKRLYKVVIPSFSVHIIAAILGFALIVVLPRKLGAYEYGIYTYAIAIMAIVVSFSSYGMNVMTVRETAALLSHHKTALWKGFYKWSLKTVLLISAIVCCIVAGVILIGTYSLGWIKETAYTVHVLYTLAVAPFYTLLNYFSGLLRGKHKTVISLVPDNVVKPAVFLAFIAVSVISTISLNAKNTIIFNAFAVIAAMLFALFVFARSANFTNEKAERDTAKWNKVLRSFFVLAAITALNSRLDVIMLGALKDASSVGIYAGADRVAECLIFFQSVMNLISSASISRLNALNEKEKLQKMITKIVRWVFICTLPFYILLVLAGKYVMHFFGPDFEGGQTVLLIIATGQLINIAFGPVGMVALMTGNEKFNKIFSVVNVVLNVVLNLVLVPMWGITGTAVATACTLIVWNVGMFISIRKETGIRTWLPG